MLHKNKILVMPMPTPMLMSRYWCWDFQMAVNKVKALFSLCDFLQVSGLYSRPNKKFLVLSQHQKD